MGIQPASVHSLSKFEDSRHLHDINVLPIHPSQHCNGPWVASANVLMATIRSSAIKSERLETLDRLKSLTALQVGGEYVFTKQIGH